MHFFKSRTGASRFGTVFGQNIPVSCEYCSNACENGCLLQKEIKNDKCAGFDYDPLLRRPRTAPPLRKYDAGDFEL